MQVQNIIITGAYVSYVGIRGRNEQKSYDDALS